MFLSIQGEHMPFEIDPSANPQDIVIFKLLKEFFDTEESVCGKAKVVAKILEKYQNDSALPKGLGELVRLYNNLSINCFSDITDGKNQYKTAEQYIDAIHKVVMHPVFNLRLELLGKASVYYAENCDLILPAVKKHKKMSENDKGEIEQCLAAPMQRLLRMQMLLLEIEKQYSKNSKEIPKKLVSLNKKFLETSECFDSMIPQYGVNPITEFQEGLTDPSKSVRIPTMDNGLFFRKGPRKLNTELGDKGDNSFLEMFTDKKKHLLPKLSVDKILAEVAKITKNPVEQLKLFEFANGKLRQHTTSNNKKMFRFTDERVKCTAKLQEAYLRTVSATPKDMAHSELDRYLERQYPRDEVKNNGGLLALDTNRIDRFINKDGLASPRKRLADLMDGKGRYPTNPAAVTSRIFSRGGITYRYC